MPPESKSDLEERFRSRLRDAGLGIDLCRAYVKRVETDAGLYTPSSDSGYAYRRALRAESYALQEFTKLLRMYSALVLTGKIPAEEAH
jgi:hypothetical protein